MAKSAADEHELPCTKGGSVTISQNKVTFQLTPDFANAKGGIQMLFLRPALRKAPATELYREMIKGFRERVSHWKLFSYYQINPERILLQSFHELSTRISGGKNALFSPQRFFIIAFEPEDAVAEFIHAVAPTSLLVVIGGPKYAQQRAETLRRADMAVVIGPEPLVIEGTNGFCVESAADVPPLIRSWIDGWIYGRNPSLVPMFGAEGALARLRARIAADREAEPVPLVLAMGPRGPAPTDRRADRIREGVAAQAEAGYLSLALRHKYWGLLQNPHMSDAEKVSWLLRVGVVTRFLDTEDVAA